MTTGRGTRRFGRPRGITNPTAPHRSRANHRNTQSLALPVRCNPTYPWMLGSSWGDDNDNGVCGNARSGGLDALDSTRARPDRNDVDLEPAICVDAVHRAAQSKTRHHAGRASVHLLAPHHPADLLLAVPGIPGRPLRAETPDLARRRH